MRLWSWRYPQALWLGSLAGAQGSQQLLRLVSEFPGALSDGLHTLSLPRGQGAGLVQRTRRAPLPAHSVRLSQVIGLCTRTALRQRGRPSFCRVAVTVAVAHLMCSGPPARPALCYRDFLNMRRRTTRTADELLSLLRALLELRAGEGNRLPGHAEAILVYLGTRPEGSARMHELRERLGLGQSRASRLCAALARAGLVEVVTPPEDRRASLIKLTAKGSRLVGRVAEALRARPHRTN